MTRPYAERCLHALALAGVAVLLAMIPSSAAASSGTVFAGSATGTVLYLSNNSFTIQTAGPRIGVLNAMTAAANRITKSDYPYVYGGGHAEAGVASIGIKGPGYNGRRRGFDCSGSVAAVLAAGGLWPAGSGVPSDAGVISTLRHEHLIVRGVATGPVAVTLYDDWGVHIFMNIDGRFFGTSDGGGGGDSRGGAGWLDDGAPDTYSRVYKAYHFRRGVLHASTSSGHILSLQVGSLQDTVSGLQLGETVQVSYQEDSSGALVATALTFPGASTTSGTVTAVASDGSSFTIQPSSGPALTFSTADDPALVQDVSVGDSVQVTYTTSDGVMTARAVADSGPSGSGPSGPPGPPGPGPGSGAGAPGSG